MDMPRQEGDNPNMTHSAHRAGKDGDRNGGSGNGRHGGGAGGSRKTQPREPSELLPLTEPVFHILLALAEREQHGYGIILAVEDATSGQVRLRTGTLYTAMKRLVEEGLIEEIESEDADAEEDRRRVYRLTPFGRAVARAESRRVASLTALARSRGLIARGARPRY
jgi:DNA-binding PadR family transcriptional regulator